MPSFPILLRRTHLYLGLLCLPWFAMYGITSIGFNHNNWFSDENNPWIESQSWPCTLVVPEAGQVAREVGGQLLDIAGMEEAAFGVYRGGQNQVNVYLPSFWEAKQLIYKIDEQRLSFVSRRLPIHHFLTSMHARAGYQHNSFWDDAWAVMVDFTMLSFLLWVATGLYIWWKTPRMRGWGMVALGSGLLSFLLFMLLL